MQLFRIVPSRIIENFFDEEEVEFLKSIPEKYPEFNHAYYGSERGNDNTVLERKIFAFNEDPNQIPDLYKSVNIIKNKVKKHFGETIVMGQAQILTAYYPYGIHTDAVYGEYGIDENHYGAWTLIIPLDDYNSSTVLFNEHSKNSKFLSDYVENNPVIDTISDEFYNYYLNHTEYKHGVRHISLEKVFDWKTNVCFAASRYKFHTSDNFPAHGVKYKQAVIVWTALPNDFQNYF